MASAQEIMLMFRGVDNVSPTTDKIKRNVTGIGDSASGIKGKISSIASSFDMVSSAITGVIGGMSLLDQATQMWDAATQRQNSQMYLLSVFGEENKQKALDMQTAIQQIVADVPGDDTFMNVIMTGALAKQTDLTTTQLREGANAIADYMMASEMNGKNAIETQQDLKTYILTGNTATLERDSILKEQLDKLEGQETVYGRIKGLTEGLAAEQYKGVSDLETASNKMTEFQGQMEKAYADLGTVFLPYIQDALSGFLDINDSVGGGLTLAIAGATTAVSGLVTGIGAIGTAFTGINSMIEFFSMLKETLFAAEVAEEALTGATIAQEIAAGTLSGEELALAAAQIGVTEAELSAAAAHAGNIPILEAEGLAATESSTGFWAMAAAEIASLWPILAIAAAVAALIVVVEQIGESLGWWTDFSTMLDAIKAGVERLWNAFINSPQVQGTLAAIQGAFQSLMSALQPVFNWLTAAWNNLFKSEGAGSGGPDVVGQLINFFGQLGDVAGQTLSYIVEGFNTIISVIDPLIYAFEIIAINIAGILDGSISWQDAFLTVISTIGSSLVEFQLNVAQLAFEIGGSILMGIVNFVVQLPSRIWTSLSQAGARFNAFSILIRARARQAGMGILLGIANYLMQLPGRVTNYMMQVPGKIAGAASAAVGAAASLASQVVSAVTNGVTGIADKIYTEFMNIPSKINSAVSDAASAAANFGSGIKDAVLNALHIASPGIIQRKIAIEFADIPGRIGESNDYVYGAAKDYAGNILKGFNAPQTSLSSMGVARQNTNYTPIVGGNKSITIVHVHEGAAPIDARNLTKREAQGMITFAFEDIIKKPEAYGG